jgi:hypothetical protein
LWKVDDLKKIEVHRNDSTVYSINASDTLSEKFKGLNTSASVKLSILSELIDLQQSAETLMKTNRTVGECSVQVRCLHKTGYKEMDMDQLTNIRYSEVARTGHNNTATHFVMKIQYGATFTKQFQSSEDEMKVKDEIDICGKTIKSVLNGSFEGNYRNFASSSQIHCDFQSFGLSLSEALPTTYDEALKFAGSFARTAKKSFARHGGEALGVPCTVWLHPLVSLPGCANAPKLHWDFTLDQACQWVEFFEDCDTFELKMLKLKLKFALIIKRHAIIRDVVTLCWLSGPPIWPLLYLLGISIDISPGIFGMEETKQKVHDVLDRKIEFVAQLRSESKTKLREMLVEIRSGTKTFEYFRQQTKLFTSRIDGLGELLADGNLENPQVQSWLDS